MVSIFIRNHRRIHEWSIDFIDFLSTFLGTRVNPTIHEFKHNMGINNREESNLLANVIEHLKYNNYIRILINENDSIEGFLRFEI